MKKSDIKELITHRIEKATNMIQEVEFLISNKKYSFAMNRIYYGLFYILSALGLKEGFTSSKHQQLIGWFNKNFIKTKKLNTKFGKIIHKAYDKRSKGDYDDYVIFEKEEVLESLKEMKEFISEVNKIIKL